MQVQLLPNHDDAGATILFLSANPASSQRLELGEECRAIENKVRAGRCGDRIRFRPRWAARPDDLLQALHEDVPSVLHFSGHGGGTQGLYFQADDGSIVAVTSDGLGQVIQAAGDRIKLVVLNACYSKVQGEALVGYVPCVIGMPGAIGDKAAITYVGDFYRALAFGKSVAVAHQCGLAALALHSAGGELRDVELARIALSTSTPEILTGSGIDASHIYIVRQTAMMRTTTIALERLRVHIEIDIDAEIEKIDAETLARVLEEACRLSGGRVVRLICVSKGSVRLTLSFDSEAARILMESRAQGQLTHLCGLEVSDVVELARMEMPLGTEPQDAAEISPTRSHVVTIGIDQYAAWPHLGSAVNDARGTSDVFRRLGFHEAHSLINDSATGDAIRKLVTDDLSTLGVNDSLVIFFAGHCGTMTQVFEDGTQLKTSYIIPVDAHNSEGRVATWIRLDSWLDDIARLPAKHILVVLDACHSGVALDSLGRGREIDRGLDDIGVDLSTWQSELTDELSRRRSRRVIVSALDDQIVLDGGPVVGHSLFTGCLIEALSGGLPREGRQTVTGTELGIHLQRRVRTYPNSRQTPDFGAFGLDDRGELQIPLFPRKIEPSAPRVVMVNSDADAALRQRLALELSKLVRDRAAIAKLVAARAPMIGVSELPTGAAGMIWLYVLAELTNCGAYSEIRAIVETVERSSRSRRSRRVDWSAFAGLFRPPTAPVVASWSHLSLELRRDSADAYTAGSALITDRDILLEAVPTLRWRGVRPDDPSIEVTSHQLFGRTMPLLHQATLLPSASPDTASWLVRIPVPRARIRTRRVTVRCVGTNLVEHGYVVPRAGSICAAMVWFAFAAFAWFRLSSISAGLITVCLTALALLYGRFLPGAMRRKELSAGRHSPRVSHHHRSFWSLFFACEIAVAIAALTTFLMIVV